MAAPGQKSFCVLEYHTSKSVVTEQRAFRAKYAKDPPTDKTSRAWYKQFTETGCLCKQKSSGRPLTAEDDDERVRASFLHSPKKSTGTATKELSMSKTTGRYGRSSGFLVKNVCNHGEHYETPCILLRGNANEELNDLYSSPNIVRVIKSRRIR
jgi:hypothetical protein